MVDWANAIRQLVDIHFPQAEKIRLVLDNLNTHTGASLYRTFAPNEAKRILDRLDFHYTPKHASWLNMAEIEIGVMNRQCLNRPMDDQTYIQNEVQAWELQRNKTKQRFIGPLPLTLLETKWPNTTRQSKKVEVLVLRDFINKGRSGRFTFLLEGCLPDP